MGKLLLFDDKFKVEHVIGENRVQKIVKATLDIPEQKPDVDRVLEVNVTPKVKNKEIIDMKKVVVDGILEAQVLYAAAVLNGPEEADPVHHFHSEVPFSEAVHIPMMHHMHEEHHHQHELHALVEIKVEDVFWRIVDSRTIEIEVVIEIFVKLTAFVQMRILTDIKGIGVIADRRRLKIESVVNEGETQKIIRRDFAIPEEKPDIEKVVKVLSDVIVTDTKVIKNKVLFEGEIVFHVVYVADTLEGDQPVHHVEFKAVFTHFIELPGICEGLNVQISPEIEAVNWKIVNSRTLRLEAVIEFFVKVTETKQTWVVTNVFGEEDIRQEKMLIKVQEVVGEDSKQIAEEFKVSLADEDDPFVEGPDIEQIISVDSKAIVRSWEVIDDKVIIEGVIKLGILYVANTLEGDQPMFFTKQMQPFTMFIDIPGAEEGMHAQFKTWIEDINWRLVDSFTIDFSVVIKVFAKVTEMRQLDVVIDATVADC